MIKSAQAEYVATQKYLSQQIKASLEVLKQGIAGHDQNVNFTCRAVDPLMQARDDLTSNMIAKELNKDNAKVESLQVQQRLLTEATGFETFSKLVKTHLGKRYQNSPTKEFHCTICLKQFTHKWKLDYHDREVHQKKNKQYYTIVKGEHPCRLCAAEFKDLYLLKKHIFHFHSDIDMRAKYGKTVE
jgi:hypothetical protein